MQHLCTLPPDQFKIVVEFLEKEGLAYTTKAETDRLGDNNLPTGRLMILTEDMDAIQQMRYVTEVVPHLMG